MRLLFVGTDVLRTSVPRTCIPFTDVNPVRTRAFSDDLHTGLRRHITVNKMYRARH